MREEQNKCNLLPPFHLINSGRDVSESKIFREKSQGKGYVKIEKRFLGNDPCRESYEGTRPRTIQR